MRASPPRQQAADIEALMAAGVEGLIVSAASASRSRLCCSDAERRGIPTVLVDRGLPDEFRM